MISSYHLSDSLLTSGTTNNLPNPWPPREDSSSQMCVQKWPHYLVHGFYFWYGFEASINEQITENRSRSLSQNRVSLTDAGRKEVHRSIICNPRPLHNGLIDEKKNLGELTKIPSDKHHKLKQSECKFIFHLGAYM